MGHPRHLFVYFRLFTQFYIIKLSTLGERIQTQIVGVEGEHADHLTATTVTFILTLHICLYHYSTFLGPPVSRMLTLCLPLSFNLTSSFSLSLPLSTYLSIPACTSHQSLSLILNLSLSLCPSHFPFFLSYHYLICTLSFSSCLCLLYLTLSILFLFLFKYVCLSILS